MHPSVARVAEALRERGATGEPVELAESTRTAAEAAAALGCDVGAIASSPVFRADDEPLLVMTSGAHRVDTAHVAQVLGVQRVARADADLVREATGFAIGGVAPVGHPAPLRTLVDTALAEHDVLWAAAGHPHAVFPTSFDELLRLTGGTAVQVAP
ncbi:MAG: YbaK/prolyl-tRNA synthetase associated region [Frankiales bacterium]|nr:YbaK/prolyl-tRNA synthetase associated region [Frankiales bacterium]